MGGGSGFGYSCPTYALMLSAFDGHNDFSGWRVCGARTARRSDSSDLTGYAPSRRLDVRKELKSES
jgi:hypothetical protein